MIKKYDVTNFKEDNNTMLNYLQQQKTHKNYGCRTNALSN